MPSVLNVARESLTERLRATVAPEIADRFVGETHARRFDDNLLPTFTQEQIATLRAQLAQGAGNELAPTRTGKRPAHAPYSSAALAINAFGRWLGSERLLVIGALEGFIGSLRVEAKVQISHGGGTANLDVLLELPGVVVGIESKLTETLQLHEPVPWKAPIERSK